MHQDGQVNIEIQDDLTRYLRMQGHIAPGERITTHILRGGVSNRTVLVHRSSGEHWVLKQALAKLRVPVDWYSSPERIHREALALRWLPKLTPPGTIPRLVFEDLPHHILAMEAVPQPATNWKTMLLAGNCASDHVAQFASILASIHTSAYARQREVHRIFADTQFFESLRLEPYYGYTAQVVPLAEPFLTMLINDTRAHPLTLVHGDYSPKNILVRAQQLVLLDHEVIHFGDPAFDVGFSLTHLLSKANYLSTYRLHFINAAKQYWNEYVASMGALPWMSELEPRAVRHTLGCLMARVAGRSPLEYLDDQARQRQLDAALHLLPAPPRTIDGLIDMWLSQLSQRDAS